MVVRLLEPMFCFNVEHRAGEFVLFHRIDCAFGNLILIDGPCQSQALAENRKQHSRQKRKAIQLLGDWSVKVFRG